MAGEDNVNNFILPSFGQQSVGVANVGVVFNGVSDMLLYATDPTIKQRYHENSDELAQTPPTVVSAIQLVETGHVLSRVCAMRRLVFESTSVFTQLCEQGAALQAMPSAARRARLMDFSQKYRSCIISAIEFISDAIAATTLEPDERHMTADERSELSACYTSLSSMQMVWHLCEIMYIDRRPGGVLLHQFIDWVRAHVKRFDENLGDILSSDSPHTHTEYWNTVYGFVLQGRVREARQLLRLHEHAATSRLFATIDELLAGMPVYTDMVQGDMGFEFEFRWQKWQHGCRSHMQELLFTKHVHLEAVLKILCGQLGHVHALLGNWYHLLASRLLYTKPWASWVDVRHTLYTCVDAYMGSAEHAPAHDTDAVSGLSVWDRLLLAVVQCELTTLVDMCARVFADGWFVLHLSDLLRRVTDSGERVKGTMLPQVGDTTLLDCVYTQMLFDFCDTLSSDVLLWQHGLRYLDQCGPHGMKRAELFLLRFVGRKTDRQARKIIFIAKQRGFTNVASAISRCMTRKYMDAAPTPCTRAALYWALQAQDMALVTTLADRLLLQHSCVDCHQGASHSPDTTSAPSGGDDRSREYDLFVDSLSGHVLYNDRLVFLAKYREFVKLCDENRDVKRALHVLTTLLKSNLVPKRYWMRLLLQGVSLLKKGANCDQIHAQDIYDLMDCLYLLTQSEKCAESDAIVVRKSLCEVLATAYIAENSKPQIRLLAQY